MKERIDSVHPSQEGDRMKLTTIIELVYYNFGVTDQMKMVNIKPHGQVKSCQDTNNYALVLVPRQLFTIF
jgi:hypothetical protein